MRSENVFYRADGLDMVGRIFIPDGDARLPGLLVFPEAFGLVERELQRAERLARLGYVTLACDIHGGGRTTADLDEAVALIGPMLADRTRMRDRADAARRALLEQADVEGARLAAIGFSVGGAMALELARSGADLKAVVGFHCPLASTSAPPRAGSIVARVLMCMGADDPQIPEEDRAVFAREMRLAGASWQMNVYGKALHSFTNPDAASIGLPDAVRYDRAAANASWAAMQHLLTETLGNES